jgi:hypothetical protein
MKTLGQYFSNYLVFVIALLLLAALQSSLWLQLFGWFPAPQLWMPILVFWVLYRELWEGVLMVYLLTVVLSGFTALSFPHFLAVNLLTCLALVFAKRRVYWAGATFFMLATGACVAFFIFFSLLVSWRYDNNPVQDVSVFGWLMTLLLTMLVSLPLHFVFSWFDRFTHKEHPTEAGTGIL